MYLSKCIINGFKSFADKIEINFKQGLSAIVGPNGCGKSNIYEAILWVLGEQRPKSLRSSKMEDVIFAGSSARSEVGMAEVTVVIEDPEQQLMNSSQVEITRRLFRSGQSEYYINGISCRLKDITKLLANTGVGKNSYAFIGQGQVEQILQSRPHELRLMFEEAAGIAHYKEQKFTTEVQLNKTQDSITRINDLISELEVDIENLTERAEKAIAHQEFTEQLSYSKKKMLINDYVISLNQLDKIDKSIKVEKQNLVDNQIKQDNLESKITINEDDLIKLQNQKNSAEKDLIRFDSSLENLKEKLIELKDKAKTTTVSLQLRQQEINEVESKQNNLTQNIESNNLLLSQLRAEYTTQVEYLAELQNSLVVTKAELEPLNVLELEQRKSSAEQKIGSLQQKLNDLTDRIKASEEKLREANNNKNILAKKQEEERNKLGNIEKELNDKKNSLTDLQNSIEDVLSSLNKQKNQIDKLNKALNDLKDQQRTNNSQLTLYYKLSNEFTGYYPGVKEILKAKKNHPKIYQNVIGVVAELITVPDHLQFAISAVLGGQAQYLVSRTAKAATQAIAMLNERRAGKATFLPLDRMSPKSYPLPEFLKQDSSFLGRAIDLIEYDTSANLAIQYLLNNVLIVENVEAALSLTKQGLKQFLVVALTGEVFSGSGTISGGRLKNNHNAELIVRQQKIKALEEQKLAIDNELNSISQKLKEYAQNYTVNTQLYEELKSRSELLAKNIAELEKQAYYTTTMKDSIINESKQVAFRIKNLSDEIEQLQIQHEENSNLVVSNETYLSNSANILNKARDLLQDLAEMQQQETRVNAEIRLLENKINNIEVTINNDINSNQSLDSRKARLVEEADSHKNVLESLKEQLEVNQSKYQQQTAVYNDLTRQLQEITSEYNEALEMQKDFREHLKSLGAESEKIKQKITRLDKKMVEQQTIHKFIDAQLYQEKITKEECQDSELMISKSELEKLRQEIKNIELSLKELGDVDYGSIADLKRRSERIDFLQKQKEDLVDAEDKLKIIISDVDKICYERLANTIKVVNENFSESYTKLFQGGSAEIQWEVDEDIFDSGIILSVCPPGKKVQNMSQLSGGEKSLTAIALLLAFSKLKESSFCMFDEVDAALDETNNIRLASYWQSISRNTQVIAITHSRHTMVHADYLFGVVMQEKGVSKVISVMLDK